MEDHLDHNNPPELNQRKSGCATAERSKSQGFSSRVGYSKDARSVFPPVPVVTQPLGKKEIECRLNRFDAPTVGR